MQSPYIANNGSIRIKHACVACTSQQQTLSAVEYKLLIQDQLACTP